MGRTTAGFLVFGVLLAAAPASADSLDSWILLNADIRSLDADGIVDLRANAALMVADLPDQPLAGESEGRFWLDAEGEGLTVTRVWENATTIRHPVTGDVIHAHRWLPVLEELRPAAARITFLQRTPEADLRLLVPDGAAPVRLSSEYVSISSTVPVGWPEPTRPTVAGFTTTRAFDEAPASGVWTTARPLALEREAGIDFYVDEWDVAISTDEGRTYEWSLGRHSATPGATVAQEAYSFLVVSLDAGRLAFSETFHDLQMVETLETMGWAGTAILDVDSGTITLDGAVRALDPGPLTLDGVFESTAEPPDPATPANFAVVAEGQGTAAGTLQTFSDRSSNLAGSPFLYALWGLLAIAVILVVAPLSVRNWRISRRPPLVGVRQPLASAPATGPPAAPSSTPVVSPPAALPKRARTPATVAALVQAVHEKPFDAAAHFNLGVLLIERGEDALGVRHLNRAFFIEPHHIVTLLKSPQFAPIREHGDVRHALSRFQRDLQRRLWSGYV